MAERPKPEQRPAPVNRPAGRRAWDKGGHEKHTFPGEAPEDTPRISEQKRLNPYFFRREKDGTVRVRMRFTAQEASVIEEGAGETPIIDYLYRIINSTAAQDAERAQQERNAQLPAPAERQEIASNG